MHQMSSGCQALHGPAQRAAAFLRTSSNGQGRDQNIGSVMLSYADEYCEYGEYCDTRQAAVTVTRSIDAASLEVLPGVANNELHNQ